MGKRGDKRRAKKVRRKYADHNISKVKDHKRVGSLLVPPLATLNTSPSSWLDDHMPEMLWAVMLAGVLPRNDYLAAFRGVAIVARGWEIEEEGAPGHFVDMTRLAKVTDEQFKDFIRAVTAYPLSYAALRPLLLIDSLPSRERWSRALGVDASPADWQTLALCVGNVIDHQSTESTDIRWLKLVTVIIAGRLFYPESMAGMLEHLRMFPESGDMRIVRPHIRAGEMVLRRMELAPWIPAFWEQVFRQTSCIDQADGGCRVVAPSKINYESLLQARNSIVERFFSMMTADRTDAKLDSAFGLVLQSLALAEEACFHALQREISGRLILRSMVEACITFRYLVKVANPELWVSYRVFGAGQAKLAFLKAQEAEGDMPSFLDEDALHAIANEDRWQEHLSIDLGHWANSNLRKIAIEAGSKDLYDRFYDWTSTIAHAHWGAVRDSNFTTCLNPLHRLHRIPRAYPRLLTSVDEDVIELANSMIRLLDEIFPGDAQLGMLTLIEA